MVQLRILLIPTQHIIYTATYYLHIFDVYIKILFKHIAQILERKPTTPSDFHYKQIDNGSHKIFHSVRCD